MQTLKFTQDTAKLLEFLKTEPRLKMASKEDGIHLYNRPGMIIKSDDSSWIISALGDTFRCNFIELRVPGSVIFSYHGYQCFSIIA